MKNCFSFSSRRIWNGIPIEFIRISEFSMRIVSQGASNHISETLLRISEESGIPLVLYSAPAGTRNNEKIKPRKNRIFTLLFIIRPFTRISVQQVEYPAPLQVQDQQTHLLQDGFPVLQDRQESRSFHPEFHPGVCRLAH